MATLEQVFNHVVLPPEIPGEEDDNLDSISHGLILRLRRACGALNSIAPNGFQKGWDRLNGVIEGFQNTIGAPLDAGNVYRVFGQAAQDDGFAVLHLKEHNAALIMYRVDGPGEKHDMVFEAFESAPRLVEVTAARDVLNWNFPSRAVKMPLEDFWNTEFLASFSSFLEKADAEPLDHLAGKIQKAGVSVTEIRDVVKPDLITHMLLSLVQSMGGIADVDVLQKRVRDDVNINGGTVPWRRLPLWLVLRVAAQRHLLLCHGRSIGYAAYKILSCTVLSQLLRDCAKQKFPIALVVMLQKKLGRKMAKLQTRVDSHAASDDTSPNETATIQALIDAVAPTFKASIVSASEYVDGSLTAFKKSNLRVIPHLPRRAANADLTLSLPNSGHHLDSLLLPIDQRQHSWNSWVAQATHTNGLPGNPSELPAVLTMAGFAKEVVDIAKLVGESKSVCAATWKAGVQGLGPSQAELMCSSLKRTMESLMDKVRQYGIDNVELNSALILEVFDNWAIMDSIMVAQVPMLGEYCPPFPADLLDLVQLPDLASMQRLRNIQQKLAQRHRNCVYQGTSIFAGIDADCFATRFAQSSDEIQSAYRKVKSVDEYSVQQKTAEWERLSEQYDDRTREVNASECSCYFSGGQRQVRGCVRCYKWRVRNRLKINTFEHYLPGSVAASNAIMFEIRMPDLLSIYIQASWTTVTRLAYLDRPPTAGKVYKVRDGSLKGYSRVSRAHEAGPVTLASSVKPFNDAHYRTVKLKTAIGNVILPLGARYKLYDQHNKAFIHQFDKPLSIAHLVRVHIPDSLRAVVMPAVEANPATIPVMLSSYDCVANRPKCPHDVSVHEFEAHQRLLSAKATRWLTMLVELGCSNINFGKEDSMLILCHLAQEAGPCACDTRDRGLGSVHHFFGDQVFVERLLDEISKRLANIKDSWRESNMMLLLITLLLRVDALADQALHRASVVSLLGVARRATLAWIDNLRGEMEAAADPTTAKRASEYGFRAALLCRRTFELLERDPTLAMSGAGLEVYVRASIAIQQNITSDANTLSALDKACLKRDTVLAFHLEDRVHNAMQAHPQSLSTGVLCGAGLGSAPSLAFEPWQFLTGSSEGWAMSWLSDRSTESWGASRQCFALHCTQGHLLVDGKTMGKLPDNIRASHEFTELFGDKHMLSYPSAMPWMSHRLMSVTHAQIIHLGQHGDKTIVLAVNSKGDMFEFVPRRHFIAAPPAGDLAGTAVYDLPRRLVDDCFHWVNRAERTVEIRKRETQWYVKESDWKLDIQARRARRRNVFLVDPFSRSCKLLRIVFEGFEDVQRLTVFQSIFARGGLSAELRHLELSFEVKYDGSLLCNELGAEVDPNQDAGTLYGYQSMIVLRNVLERDRRCIILPLSEIACRRRGCHIAVLSKTDTSPQYSNNSRAQQSPGKAYARFDIDTVLGRLTCPPEPRILYTKAQLHAFTSTPVPDPLTGRTGEEEAIHTLLSGRCQPWKSLPDICHSILGQIMTLAPTRDYYPRNMRVMQRASWSEFLPVGIQSDRYKRIIRAIIAQADTLSQFEETGPSGGGPLTVMADAQVARKTPDANDEDNANTTAALEARGEIQRMRYECAREDLEPDCPVAPVDRTYVSLGRVHVSPSSDLSSDVKCKAGLTFQIARLLMTERPVVAIKQHLSTILNRWSEIGGVYEGGFEGSLVPMSTYMESRFLSEVWGSLVEMCRTSTRTDRARNMFTLCSLAFAPETSPDAIHLLAAYCYMDRLQAIEPPVHDMYSGFKYNEALTVKSVMDIIEGEYVEYVEEDIYEIGWGTVERVKRERRAAHLAACRNDAKQLASEIVAEWPDSEFPEIAFYSDFINVAAALSKVQGLWERLSHNRDLSEYVTQVQEELDTFVVRPVSHAPPGDAPAVPGRPKKYAIPSLADLASRDIRHVASQAPCVKPSIKPQRSAPHDYRAPTEFAELGCIVQKFAESTDAVRSRYGQDLADSLQALNAVHAQQHGTDDVDIEASFDATVSTKLGSALARHADKLRTLRSRLAEARTGSHGMNWLEMAGLWPRLNPVPVLDLLRTDKRRSLGDGVFQSIVDYGLLLANTQRLYRLRKATAKADARRTKEELSNAGHTNWHPADRPDWLLMELDANMLIREEQVTVAHAMIEPASQSNSVFQLNMGQGKTSVILPMVLAVLADGNHLARMIVPKSLILPTAQVIQTRLGGLVGRQVRHISFSRRLIASDNTEDLLSRYKTTHMDLVASRGMLIAAPEHILAFKLCGLQCIADGKADLGVAMVAFQTELEQTLCRDVLDESDFTLAVRTQLVYPSGDLTAIDGAPYRWQLVQQLLALVRDHAFALSEQFPEGLKVIPQKKGGFPMIHILQPQIETLLHGALVRDVCSGRVPLFRAETQRISAAAARPGDDGDMAADVSHILERTLTAGDGSADIAQAASLYSDAKAVENGLLLVRGLIKHGILTTCLKKRWNVQYGLHPGRWPIAVPFEARGVPSERSEFGHPDVSIIFTCLAFYYAGVDMAQFRKSLENVLHHVDDPATEYEKWSSGDAHTVIPLELQSWNAINTDDQGQVEKLWTHLRYSRSVINHYLNKFVFPQHSRQFSVKLQASAWDLPLITHTRRGETATPRARTTGFSGTNDNKSMLPLPIKQDNLPGFSHTNAEVSAYFLQARNREYVCTTTGSVRWNERDFVSSLRRKNIRVLIDAGAFILELSNEILARSWLGVADGAVKAAVFFDEKDDRAMVVFREATAQKVPLVSSPYADRLDECVVYFDEAHTRGVDLQLPPGAKGAVTLALGQTRDHTVQAALRLRQLATTQSVVFYAPPEVDQSIRDVCREHHGFEPPRLGSPHVVAWLLEQTCRANEQLNSLYTAHGRDFCQRTDSIWTHRYTLDDAASRDAMLKTLEQPERQTLETMYGTAQAAPSQKAAIANAQLNGYMNVLRHSQSSSHGSGTYGAAQGAFEEVEQEREVEVQVEEEDIPERRVVYKALSFPGVAESIRAFVMTGSVTPDSGCLTAFASVAATNIGRRHGIRASDSKLYISAQFGRTIKPAKKGAQSRDDFLRPTEWLLWCPRTETGVVVISEELEALMPLLRQSRLVHLVTYAAAVTRSMLDFSSLTYLSYPAMPANYVFPAWLAVEMGILAGRLYMRYSEAQAMTAYLRACTSGDVRAGAGFCNDPSSFLLEWLPLRRTAQDILHTPAAYVCQGRPLQSSHAFFLQDEQAASAGDDSASNDDEPASSSSGIRSSTAASSPNNSPDSSPDSNPSEVEQAWVKLQDMTL